MRRERINPYASPRESQRALQSTAGQVRHLAVGGLGYPIEAYFVIYEARIPPGEIAVGLSTLLYGHDDRTRTEAWKLFPHTLGRGCIDGHPDLSHIRDHVTGKYRKPEIAEPVKRAVFEAMPRAAFLLFLQAEADRNDWIPYKRLERTIDNALYEKKHLGGLSDRKIDAATAKAMRELGESKYWWSRMFVAEVMVQNKEFRDQDLIKRLLEDEYELVRSSVASIENPDPLRAVPVDK